MEQESPTRCFLTHPSLPKPLWGPDKTTELGLRVLEENSAFEIRKKTAKGALIVETIQLPERPKGCPEWRYALTLIARYKEKTAAVFLVGTYRWLWILESRVSPAWTLHTQPLQKEVLLGSIAANKSPHELFFAECCACLENPPKGVGVQDKWPPLMRLRWLEVLLDTNVWEFPTATPDRTTQIEMETGRDKVLAKIMEGATATIFSMAAFCPNEIPLAKLAVETQRGNEEIRKPLLETITNLC